MVFASDLKPSAPLYLSKTLVLVPCDLARALDSLSFLAALRHADDSVQIDVLASVGVAALFENSRQVTQVWRYEFEETRSGTRLSRIFQRDWLTRVDVARSMHKERYDRVIFFDRSRYKPIFALFFGIKARWGFEPSLPFTLTRAIRLKPHDSTHKSRLVDWLALADLRGTSGFSPSSLVKPEALSAPAIDPRYVRRKFGISALSPIVLFVVGATTHRSKIPTEVADRTSNIDWPNRHWFELARLFQSSIGKHQIVFLGSTRDRSRATEIATLIGPQAHNICGMTALHETMALMAGAHAIVSIDHILLQLASAMGTPSVGIFGGTDPRPKAPRTPTHRNLWLHLECSPCIGPTCKLGRPVCLERLTPHDALDAIAGFYPAKIAP